MGPSGMTALAIPSAGATTTDAAVEIILQSYVWTE